MRGQSRPDDGDGWISARFRWPTPPPKRRTTRSQRALVAAALYEMTPIKTRCLRKCRSPLGSFLSSWRNGLRGAFTMGTRHGAWCLGCCWALMLALFALGVMSPT